MTFLFLLLLISFSRADVDQSNAPAVLEVSCSVARALFALVDLDAADVDVDADALGRRPAYRALNGGAQLHLYATSNGRWLLGERLGSEAGVAFVDSWAVTPDQIATASPNARWQVGGAGRSWQQGTYYYFCFFKKTFWFIL